MGSQFPDDPFNQSAPLARPPQSHDSGPAMNLVSRIFASLSLFLLVLSIAGSISAHQMAASLVSQVNLSSPGYAHPWDDPSFNWHLYAGLAYLGWISFFIGCLTIVVALVCGHIGFREVRRGKTRPGKHFAAVGLTVGYLCVLLIIFSGVLAFLTLFDFWGWGFTF